MQWGNDALISRHQMIVLVAVDSELSRQGLATMLDSIPAVAHVVGCGDVHQAVDTLNDRPDINVLIVSPGDNCSEVLRQRATAELRARLKILFLIREPEQQYLEQLAACPVDGFLLEADLTQEWLAESLVRLSNGEMPMPTALAREMLSHMNTRRQARPHPATLLTPREQLTLTLLVEGLSNKQIARRIGISEHGAKRHVANVLAKLNCPNRTLAVAVALREGFIKQSDG
jgi:two-component system nitrate/nitrite response regulator NarL